MKLVSGPESLHFDESKSVDLLVESESNDQDGWMVSKIFITVDACSHYYKPPVSKTSHSQIQNHLDQGKFVFQKLMKPYSFVSFGCSVCIFLRV